MPQDHPSQFLYHFDPVRPELVTNPKAWSEEDLQIATDHVNYLKQATAAGTVILAGRSLDGQGPALVIIEVKNKTQARAFMENDPFVKKGLMRASLHPFRAAFVRKT